MSRPLPTLRAVGGLAMIAALATLAAMGCGTKTVAPPPPDAPPPANSPANVVTGYAWAINHRDVGVIEKRLTSDFQIVGAGTDTAGNQTRVPWDRAWFLAGLDSMMAYAEQVTLVFDQNLIAFPDSRPGKSSTWHKQVRPSLVLKVRIDSGNTIEVTGNALFFLTRGDSALIPQEFLNRGVKADSTTWWIDRYEDETLSGGGAPPSATDPTRNYTFTYLLELFLHLVRF